MKIWSAIRSFFTGVGEFPSNILVTAPHGSARVPLRIFPQLSMYYQTSPRLLLNFSDYGTKYLIEKIPDASKVIPKYGRLIGDCNRSANAPDIVRFEDFGGNKIFRGKFEGRLKNSLFRFFWKQKVLNLSYKPFYRDVYAGLKRLAEDPKNEQRPIILVDVHDVGNRILGARQKQDTIREQKLPKVIISNAPDLETSDGLFGTAPDYFVSAFADILAKNLEVRRDEVKINHIFKGGNMIRNFGNPYGNQKLRRILNGKPILAVQVEFNRGLYLNEVNQRPYLSKVRMTRSALMETLRQVAEFSL